MVEPTNRDLPLNRPSLTIDWEVYAAMLEETDMPLDQQKELIETLWSLVVMFVDLGFDLHPVQQVCGEPVDTWPAEPADLVSFLKEQNINPSEHKEDPWQD